MVPPRLHSGFVGDHGFDIHAARAFLEAKERRRSARLEQLLGQARHDAANIRRRLIVELNPCRLYQWGSLVHTEHFSEISDIDFAIEGLRGPREYFAAVGIAMDETEFPIDIVEIEKLDAETMERIIRRGRLVYDRGSGVDADGERGR